MPGRPGQQHSHPRIPETHSMVKVYPSRDIYEEN